MRKKVLAGILAAGLILPVGTVSTHAATGRGYGCGRYYVDEDGDGVCDHASDSTCPRAGIGQSRRSKKQSLKAKVSLRKGKKYCVKLQNNAKGMTYRTTNCRVATVSKKGVVKARRKGTCTVYVYAKKKIQKKVKLTVL